MEKFIILNQEDQKKKSVKIRLNKDHIVYYRTYEEQGKQAKDKTVIFCTGKMVVVYESPEELDNLLKN